MARKSSRAPRKPTVPSPQAARPVPRRPSGMPPVAVAGPVVRSEADYVGDYSHVRRDLKRIAVIAVCLFAVIFAAPFILQ